MIGFVCALEKEGRGLRQFLGLKSLVGGRPFPVATSEQAALVVSGVGKVRAAAATSHLLTRFPVEVLVNFGIAGSTALPPGTAVLANQVKDEASGGSYYPDVLLQHPFQEGSLLTVDRPRSQPVAELVCDMEASGVVDAALRYLTSSQVVLVKVVSDPLDPARQLDVPALLQPHLETTVGLARALRQRWQALPGDLNNQEQQLLDRFSAKWGFTVAQQRELKQSARIARVRGQKLGDLLACFQNRTVDNKREARQLFEELQHIFHTA